MIKTYDQGCDSCEWEGEIWREPFAPYACPVCGAATSVRYKRMGMIRDEIPGGQWIENLGHDPIKVYSKSELKQEMAARGLSEMVRHMPLPGSDKSPHTTRWTGAPDMRLPKHYEDKALTINAPTPERPTVDTAA